MEIKPENAVITDITTPKKKCKMCGSCCKLLVFTISGIEKQSDKIRANYTKLGWLGIKIPGLSNNRLRIEYYKAKGLKRKGDYLTVPNLLNSWFEGDQLIIEYICPLLTKDNKCSIWGKHPLLCKRWQGQSTGYYVPKCCVWHPDNQ